MNHARTVLKTRPISRVKLGGRGQVTIPPGILKRLRLKHGEELNVGVFERDRAIILAPRPATRGEPSRTIPKDQEWYYTPRWQKMMQEAFDAYDKGQMLGPFESVEEFKQAVKGRAHPQ